MAGLTPEQKDEAAMLYTEHEWSIYDLAEHFECSRPTVASALLKAGVALRPSHQAQPALRMKQCTNCLHFLPVGLFSWVGRSDKRRIASWCNACTAHPKPAPWRVDPQPLADALGTWRTQ